MYRIRRQCFYVLQTKNPCLRFHCVQTAWLHVAYLKHYSLECLFRTAYILQTQHDNTFQCVFPCHWHTEQNGIFCWRKIWHLKSHSYNWHLENVTEELIITAEKIRVALRFFFFFLASFGDILLNIAWTNSKYYYMQSGYSRPRVFGGCTSSLKKTCIVQRGKRLMSERLQVY